MTSSQQQRNMENDDDNNDNDDETKGDTSTLDRSSVAQSNFNVTPNDNLQKLSYLCLMEMFFVLFTKTFFTWFCWYVSHCIHM